ncbi:MAG: GerW family sporulation protein [Clostridia bacterium]|nr:GerW family sporulation protein [Clostridia bacterium]
MAEEKKTATEAAAPVEEKGKTANHPIKGMMDVTLSKIKDMVDVSTIIGDPIMAGETTIIPISKMAYGFASGGSDFDGKSGHRCFGGGGGAGVTIQPVAFLVIHGSNVRLLQIDNNMNSLDKAVGMIPNLVDKVSDLLSGSGKDKDTANASDEPEVTSENAEKAEPLTLDVTVEED